MREPDRTRETEPGFLSSIGSIRLLVRLAPIVAFLATLAGGCKNEIDPELQACREEVARLEGVLLGAGVESKLVDDGADDSTDLQGCRIRQSRLQGFRSSKGILDPSRLILQGGGTEGGSVTIQLPPEVGEAPAPDAPAGDGARPAFD